MGTLILGTAVSLCLGLAFGMSMAQTMYKCVGADGKVEFSDKPCPSKPGAKQEKRGDTVVAPDAPFMPAERARIVRHLMEFSAAHAASPPETGWTGISEKEARDWLAKWERECAAGHRPACGTLANLRVRALGLTPAERRVVLQNMMTGANVGESDREAMAKLRDELEKKCTEGTDRYACEALVAYKTKTAGEILREGYSKACARGHKLSCDALKELKR